MSIIKIAHLSPEGVLSENCTHSIKDEVLVHGLQMMLKTRHIDERMVTLQRQGTITFALSSYGEECCAVATAAALDNGDWLYPQYREAGVMFWRGFSTQQFVHQMFGNAKDIILGRQMPNHFGSKELNVVTVSSPIGTKIPHAAGCAYAMKIQGEKQVAVCFFGDGASSEGDFHAGVNFAAVLKAPAIFFCRNNGFAISTKINHQFSSPDIASKGIGYGIETMQVDGNDFFAVHEAVSKAKEYCLKGKGPVLIEAMTYRLGAHSTSDDPTRYRDEKEVKAWEKKDPIHRLRTYLTQKNLWSKEKEESFAKEIADEVTEAIHVAKETEKPPLKSLIEHVYFEIPQGLQEQYEELIEE